MGRRAPSARTEIVQLNGSSLIGLRETIGTGEKIGDLKHGAKVFSLLPCALQQLRTAAVVFPNANSASRENLTDRNHGADIVETFA